MAACDQALELDDTRQQILHYIETRMNILAPNLTYVVGSNVAALMMSAAGGLQELSRMPSCNIQMIGAKRKVVNGMSTAALGTRGGVINQSPVVLNCPPDYRQKAVKLVAAKCTLAARVDASNECASGDVGVRFKKQVEDALAKSMEAPPQKKAKALPCPDEKHKKKRGGKRARAIKEKFAQSEMLKLANRVQFGVQEAEVFGGTDETIGLGSLGKIAAMHSGRLRVAKKEVKLLNNRAKDRANNGLSSQIKGQHHGLISSVVMNSTTGMVFEAMASDGTGTVTPVRLSKRQAPSSRYFGGNNAFVSAEKKQAAASGPPDARAMPPPAPREPKR
jgi:U4/U6 small nuclear ribonucleoprotein PRP31